MNTAKNAITALLSGLFLAASANALMWEDYDYVGEWMTEGESYTGSFSITAPVDDYDPALHHVTSARVGFSFADSNDDSYGRGGDGKEWVDVWIDATQIFDHVEVDGSRSGGFDWIWSGLNGFLVADLQDGMVNYTVQVENKRDGKRNDVWFKEAKLKAWGGYKQVPDSGASLALLGLGMAFIVGIRKRVAK